MISVADSGTGIRTQDIDRIFTPLYSTKSHGMGMGLSICRAIVEAHDGRLWMTPNTPTGTVFRFTVQSGDPARADPAISPGSGEALSPIMQSRRAMWE